jgi:hypothetical protein
LTRQQNKNPKNNKEHNKETCNRAHTRHAKKKIEKGPSLNILGLFFLLTYFQCCFCLFSVGVVEAL